MPKSENPLIVVHAECSRFCPMGLRPSVDDDTRNRNAALDAWALVHETTAPPGAGDASGQRHDIVW